jgi:hypothetical protein
MGDSAERIAQGLDAIYDAVQRSGARLVAIPPLAAPGFVSHSDPKEHQRLELARLIKQSATRRNARAALEASFSSFSSSSASSSKSVVPSAGAGVPAMVVVDEGEPGKALDLWQRREWLDDGLHLKPVAYDKIGEVVAGVIARSLLGVPEEVIAAAEAATGATEASA